MPEYKRPRLARNRDSIEAVSRGDVDKRIYLFSKKKIEKRLLMPVLLLDRVKSNTQSGKQ